MPWQPRKTAWLQKKRLSRKVYFCQPELKVKERITFAELEHEKIMEKTGI